MLYFKVDHKNARWGQVEDTQEKKTNEEAKAELSLGLH